MFCRSTDQLIAAALSGFILARRGDATHAAANGFTLEPVLLAVVYWFLIVAWTRGPND